MTMKFDIQRITLNIFMNADHFDTQNTNAALKQITPLTTIS